MNPTDHTTNYCNILQHSIKHSLKVYWSGVMCKHAVSRPLFNLANNPVGGGPHLVPLCWLCSLEFAGLPGFAVVGSGVEPKQRLPCPTVPRRKVAKRVARGGA